MNAGKFAPCSLMFVIRCDMNLNFNVSWKKKSLNCFLRYSSYFLVNTSNDCNQPFDTIYNFVQPICSHRLREIIGFSIVSKLSKISHHSHKCYSIMESTIWCIFNTICWNKPVKSLSSMLFVADWTERSIKCWLIG